MSAIPLITEPRNGWGTHVRGGDLFIAYRVDAEPLLYINTTPIGGQFLLMTWEPGAYKPGVSTHHPTLVAARAAAITFLQSTLTAKELTA